jgi:hypothetical protein
VDLKKAILKEYSKGQVDKIVNYVGNKPERFKALLNVYLAGPYRVTQRASWPLSYCVQNHPELVKSHLKTVIGFVNTPNVHDAVKRNTLRLLQYIDIPKRHYGAIADLCFTALQNKKEPVAIKAFSITVLSKLVDNEPDLKNELKLILEDQLPYASPAFRVRAVKFLKDIRH